MNDSRIALQAQITPLWQFGKCYSALRTCRLERPCITNLTVLGSRLRIVAPEVGLRLPLTDICGDSLRSYCQNGYRHVCVRLHTRSQCFGGHIALSKQYSDLERTWAVMDAKWVPKSPISAQNWTCKKKKMGPI